MHIKVIKKANLTTGREQRYESVAKVTTEEDRIKVNVQQWILAVRTRKLQDQIAAYDFRNIQ